MTMNDEKWRAVVGYDGRYEVSDLGRVRSLGRWCRKTETVERWVPGKYLAFDFSRGSYPFVTLFREAVRQKAGVANLVARAFIGPVPEGMELCHKDGVRTNAALSNLRYGTRKSNCEDRDRHGTTARGERNGWAKLTSTQVLGIRAAAGNMTGAAISREIGVSERQVGRILKGEAWAHMTL